MLTHLFVCRKKNIFISNNIDKKKDIKIVDKISSYGFDTNSFLTKMLIYLDTSQTSHRIIIIMLNDLLRVFTIK